MLRRLILFAVAVLPLCGCASSGPDACGHYPSTKYAAGMKVYTNTTDGSCGSRECLFTIAKVAPGVLGGNNAVYIIRRSDKLGDVWMNTYTLSEKDSGLTVAPSTEKIPSTLPDYPDEPNVRH